MFEWKVEDMVLMNQKGGLFLNKEKIYDCESKVSREDKIAFVDSFQDGKLSYLLYLIDKFNKDYNSLAKTKSIFGNEEVKTVSLKAWINRTDTKYSRPILDNSYKYGEYYILGSRRNIRSNSKYTYDTYDDLVDEIFHRQLKECEDKERNYFAEHDEYSILKKKFRDRNYHTTFGVRICDWSNGRLTIKDSDNEDLERDITIDELKDLLSKYEQLDFLVEKLTAETHIVY